MGGDFIGFYRFVGFLCFSTFFSVFLGSSSPGSCSLYCGSPWLRPRSQAGPLGKGEAQGPAQGQPHIGKPSCVATMLVWSLLRRGSELCAMAMKVCIERHALLEAHGSIHEP